MIAQQRPLEHFEQHDRVRGRIEHRRVAVYEAPQQLDAGWQQVRRVIHVIRSGLRDKQSYERESYYITSRLADAACYARGIRGHWDIENRLHYVKDVRMNEDGSGVRVASAAANLSLLRSLALTCYRHQGYDSIKTATVRFANKIRDLLQLLSN